MDQLILAAHDVVEAWENHTLDLEEAIRRLADTLATRASRPQDATADTPQLSPVSAR